MAGAAIEIVEPLGVQAVQALHPGGEIRLWGLDEEVVMVRHQAEAVAAPAEPFDDLAEHQPKELEVAWIPIDGAASNATRPEVVRAAGYLRTGQSRHVDEARRVACAMGCRVTVRKPF